MKKVFHCKMNIIAEPYTQLNKVKNTFGNHYVLWKLEFCWKHFSISLYLHKVVLVLVRFIIMPSQIFPFLLQIHQISEICRISESWRRIKPILNIKRLKSNLMINSFCRADLAEIQLWQSINLERDHQLGRYFT